MINPPTLTLSAAADLKQVTWVRANNGSYATT